MKINFKQCNSDNYSSGRSQQIQFIVVHYTSNRGDTAKNNVDYFAREDVGASAHYFVDENEAWQSVKDSDVAWHCGAKTYYHDKCRNANSLGVEICMNDKTGKVREGSINNAAELVRFLMKKYNVPIDNVLRHYDVTHKNCVPIDTTEFLTKNGWLKLDKLSVGEEIASYVPENNSIEFQKILNIVEPYKSEVISCRELEATLNHRMYSKPNCSNSKKFKETTWGEILKGGKQHIIKNGAIYYADGLNLSNDQIRLLVWVQGDGHYMKKEDEICGLEFHLKKKRKIDRIKELLNNLNIEYSLCNKTDGSVSVRIYNKDIIYWCENWLNNKKFTYKLIEMNQEQFIVFWNELLCVDGHSNTNSELYTSTIENNLDVVQAICATKGFRTNKINMGDSKIYNHATTLVRNKSNYSIGGKKKKVTKRECLVSCVSVPSSYILIRQNGKTFIVGNCPEPMVTNTQLWENFKSQLIKNDSEEEEMKVYKHTTEMPDWARDTFVRLIKAGIVAVDKNGEISVQESSLQPMVYMDRLTGGKLEQFPEFIK